MTTAEEHQILDTTATSIRNYPACMRESTKDMQMILGSELTLKQIQCEAAKKGHSLLIQNEHIKQYIRVMDKIRYAPGGDKKRLIESGNNKDRYPFSYNGHPFRIFIKIDTQNDLYSLSEKIDMEYTHVLGIALILGYQQVMSEASNLPRMELYEAIKRECQAFDWFFQKRVAQKVIEYYDTKIDLEKKTISWSD